MYVLYCWNVIVVLVVCILCMIVTVHTNFYNTYRKLPLRLLQEHPMIRPLHHIRLLQGTCDNHKVYDDHSNNCNCYNDAYVYYGTYDQLHAIALRQ